MGKQHVIELNGKRYDALTGKVIASEPVHTSQKAKPVKAAPVHKGGSIDGFAKAPRSTSTTRNMNPATAHKTEKSKTLMRKTVAQPKPVKPVAATKIISKEITHGSATDRKRLQHAKSVSKSPAISRFSANAAQPTTRPSSPAAKVPATTTLKKTVATAAVSTATTSRSLVDKALAAVEPKEAPKFKKEKRSVRIARTLHLTPRQVSVGGFAIAAFLIVGFFAHQNATNISMRIASSRAGIQGSLPGYQPAGFGVAGGVAYNPGQVTISYKSASDDRNFKIMQNVSDWNSQALLDNFVATNHPNNQTIQDRGKTVYLYDGNNATWVDGGIWYRIEGASQLNSDQLLNIAASL